ncbi:MAG: response regulator transcription factor [Stenotrophomonas maltophilia]
MKILVADNDPGTIEAVGICLSLRWPHGEMCFPEDREDLLNLISHEALDLVVLNSGLYAGSGYSICREIRAFSAVPVIMTIPTDDEADLIRALDAGADDCMDQPVGAPELLARMVAIFRRTQRLPLVKSSRPFVSGHLYINFDANEVRMDGDEVKLTFTEFELLRCLVNNPKRVMSHSQLACLVWGEEDEGSRNSLKVHIQHLRQKLGESAGKPKYIFSERGCGYKFAA